MTDATGKEPAEQALMREHHRMLPLDGLRGFASLYVIVAHLCPPFPTDRLWLRVVRTIIGFGWSGVDLFFVLSGFLITGILLRTKTRSLGNYFGVFYARRFLRVFPPYYALLVVLLLVVPHVTWFARYNNFWMTSGAALPYWAYLSNWFEARGVGTHAFLCVCWSLAIEEQYYLVWPLAVRLLNRRNLVLASAFLFALSALLRAFLFVSGRASAVYVYHMTFTHLDGIALGSALAVAYANRLRWARLLDRYARLLPLFLGLLSIAVLYAGLSPSDTAQAFRPAMVLNYWLIALTFGSLLMSALGDGITNRIFSSPFLRWLGKYSYAAYLFQFVIAWVVQHAVGHVRGRVPWVPAAGWAVLQFFVAVAGAYGAAVVSWRLLEGPLDAFKSRAPMLNGSRATGRRAPRELPGSPGPLPRSPRPIVQ